MIKADWVLGNEEDAATLWTLGQWSIAFRHDLAKRAGSGLPHFFTFRGDHMQWFLDAAWLHPRVTRWLARVQRDPGWLTKIYRDVVAASDDLYAFARGLSTVRLHILNDAELAAVFTRHTSLLGEILGWGFIPVLLDAPTPRLSTQMTAWLDDLVRQRGIKGSGVEYFSQLTAVADQNIQRDESVSLKQLAIKLLRRRLRLGSAHALQLIEQHRQKYIWAYFGYVGPELTQRHLRHELAALLSDPKQLRRDLARALAEPASARTQITRLEKKLGLTLQQRKLFAGIRDDVRMKIYRRDAISFSFWATQPALRELGRRTGLDHQQVHNVAPWEVARLLQGDQRLLASIRQRTGKLCLGDGSTNHLRVVVGAQARRLVRQRYHPVAVGKLRELTGQPACLGTARGVVKVINVPADMAKMQPGDIMMSIATSPDLVPAMKKAAAIVTEQGGITSHAAIVSRELGVPCVIGTKIAMQVFKDGDRVEVDATKGIVRRL